MKGFTALSGLILLACSLTSQARNYAIDSKLSRVSFATIKLQYVVEPATIDGIHGELNEAGEVRISIPLQNISTGIDIRNQRLNTLFFNSVSFPEVTVSAKLPPRVLQNTTHMEQISLAADVTLSGTTRTLPFVVNLVKTEQFITVSTATPAIIDGSTFGIPLESLSALAATVGGIPISNKVPVTFSLIMTQTKK